MEEQNLLRAQELEQAKHDEAARLKLAAAEQAKADEVASATRVQAQYNAYINELIQEIKALIEVTQGLLAMRDKTHNNMGDRIDAILELQRIVVSRMLKDTSDQAELERITSILREATGTRLSVQSGLNVAGGRDATLSAGQDITSTTS